MLREASMRGVSFVFCARWRDVKEWMSYQPGMDMWPLAVMGMVGAVGKMKETCGKSERRRRLCASDIQPWPLIGKDEWVSGMVESRGGREWERRTCRRDHGP